MDIRMPELDGLEATRRILAADPDSRILILTTFDLDEYVYRALRAGASGFVLKDDPPEQLIAAVRTVAGGDALLSPSVTRRVIAAVHPRATSSRPQAVETLTAREMDVFRLITRGLLERRDRSASCSSATPRSRPTSPGCCRSSTCATGRRRSCSPTRPASSSSGRPCVLPEEDPRSLRLVPPGRDLRRRR